MASHPIRWFSLVAMALVAIALVAAAALLAAAPAAAGSSSCKRVKLKAPQRKLPVGGWVRVRGRTCRDSASRPSSVRIKMRKPRGWRKVGRARTRADGTFSKRIHLVPPRGRHVVRLRAFASKRESKTVKVLVDRDCALGKPGADIGMTLDGCRLVASDTAANPDPRSFWGNVDCGTRASPDLSRHQNLVGGGDNHPTATGAPQGDGNYRRLTVLDGDDYYGERCELGRNDHRTGPTAFYREGQRRATFVSLRLPSNLSLGADTWQNVVQMKQAQPADGGGGVPILHMGAYRNQWHIETSLSSNDYWAFPAQAGIWTRFAFDVFYSQDPQKGWLQVSADLNGDGDFDDPAERSPVIRTATLKTEIEGPNGSSDTLAVGDPIPSTLRAGIYHNPSYVCPAPTGCSAEVDNVQVLAP